jgi:hypothetical protein
MTSLDDTQAGAPAAEGGFTTTIDTASTTL